VENLITLAITVVVFIGIALVLAVIEKILLRLAGAPKAEVEEVIPATSDDVENHKNGGAL
jgi:hypothetical protein